MDSTARTPRRNGSGLTKQADVALAALHESPLDLLPMSKDVRLVRLLFMPTFHRNVLIVVEALQGVARIACTMSGTAPRREENVLPTVELDALWNATGAVDYEDGPQAQTGTGIPLRLDIDDWSGRRTMTGVADIVGGPVATLVDEMVALVRTNLLDDDIDQALCDVERYLVRE